MKQISDLLNTGLDEETLQVCVQLLEAGVNPEALAAVVQELRRETAVIRVSKACVLLNRNNSNISAGRGRHQK